MADNLDAKIRVDASQAVQQIGLVNSALRDLRKEHKAAADQMRAGTGDPQEYARISRALYELEQQLRGLTRAQRESNQVTKEHSVSLRELGLELGHFSHAAGIGIEGIKALKFGFTGLAVAEAIRFFKEAVKGINDLNIAAKEAGTTVGTIKALRTELIAAGDDADKAAPMLASVNKVIREARQRDVDVGTRATEAFAQTLAAGGDQAAARQAAESTARQMRISQEYSGVLEKLNIDLSKYNQTEKDDLRLKQDIAKAVLGQKDRGFITQAETAALQIYGRELAVIEPELRKIAEGALKIEEPTEGAVRIMGEYNKAVADAADLWEKVTTNIGLAGAAGAVALTQAESYRRLLQGFPAAPAATAEAPIPPAGQAAGGYIRGPGSGTSDSILARLSNGEFVINAGSVRRLGVGFLQGLNSFATGGLVGMRPLSFAGGGSVSAGGRPVHLHLGAQSFALSGSSNVVDALVSHAHSAQMRSAGVKPSWYAGTPGGR